MTCKKYENLLPAYLDDVLTVDEKKCIADHLASCNQCRQVLTDLKKTMALLQDLKEVEPPPFFAKRIMARVRTAAGQEQGILRRFFYSLHIKIPVQALATVLVAVLAFYVYQQGGPEMKPTTPFSIPMAEREKKPVIADSSRDTQDSATISPSRRTKDGEPMEENPRPWAPPADEKGERKNRVAEMQAPEPKEHTISGASQAPDTAKKETPRPSDQAEIVSKKQTRADKQAIDGLLEASPVEPQLQQKKTEREISSRESRKLASSTLPRAGVSKIMERSSIDVALRVLDRRAAVRQIEEQLQQAGARIIEGRRDKDQDILWVEIVASHVPAFLDQLRTIGGLQLGKESTSLPDGAVTLTIRLTHP